jgi:lysozyme
LIHQFEGCAGQPELTRAKDPDGNWEIGWSHKLSGPSDPLWDSTLTPDLADTIAMQDLGGSASEVCNALGDAVNNLSDNQYAACIDFTYNEGGGNFASSTFAKLIEQDDLADAANQLPRWVYGGGQVLAGLVHRRAAEVALWNTP